MCMIFQSIRVCKLTGKPAFLTIADCEFKARRIQNAVLAQAVVFSPLAAKSNAFRTHWEVIFCKGVRIHQEMEFAHVSLIDNSTGHGVGGWI